MASKGLEAIVKEVKCFDPKYASKAKTAAEKGAAQGAKAKPVESALTVELKVLVEKEDKQLVGTCTWLIRKGAELAPKYSQAKKARATVTYRGDPPQSAVDDVAAGAAEAEMAGIAKFFNALEEAEKKKKK